MKNETYDILKFVAQLVLPALATLYAALGGLWGLPYVNEVSGSIMAVDAFMGAVLQVSTNVYNKEIENGD